MTIALVIDEIVSDPAIRGGRPTLRGTTLRVIDVVTWYRSGDFDSAEELAASIGLTAGQVHAALAYYYLHQPEVEGQMDLDDARGERAADDLIAQGRARRIE
ncbi:MAG: DUF433 domain-containing protein [Anaerolineae bacterium]|nr:DUF433 domain-containing protein [Anaerolineae bacterium]